MQGNTAKLEPGDILVYWGKHETQHQQRKPTHIALALDGGYILHNTINPTNKFAGVVKHKAQPAAQGYLNNANTKIDVYRTRNLAVAQLSTKYGAAWADNQTINKGADFAAAGKGASKPNSQIVDEWNQAHEGRQHGDFKTLTPDMNPWFAGSALIEFRGGKSPYSSKRLEIGQQSALKKWDLMSAFRAVKAYVRQCTQLGLSPRHGTSCDQFVMFCYQAASLESMLGPAQLDENMIELVSKNAKNIKLYLEDGDLTKDLGENLKELNVPAFDKLKETLKAMTGQEGYMGFLPQAMCSDAKTSSVEKLHQKIVDSDSGFGYVGGLTKAGEVDSSIRLQESGAKKEST